MMVIIELMVARLVVGYVFWFLRSCFILSFFLYFRVGSCDGGNLSFDF